MEIRRAKVFQDYLEGVLIGNEVSTNKKIYKDAKTFYASIDRNVQDDEIMYEVYVYTQGEPKQAGNLNWGLTVMKPVYVNQECNITRGHFHENLNCAEIYFCLHGTGLLLLMDDKGVCSAEEMSVGSVHHIDGKLAHRLVNTSDTELKVGACWPSDAGHDYQRIEEDPFKVRIYKIDGEIVVKEDSK